MNNRLWPIFLLLLICTAVILPARGLKDKAGAEQGKLVQAAGKVRLVGSDPFPELVITNAEHEWHVAKEEEHKLKDLQHRTVTVEGNETVTELRYANGTPAGQRRDLKNIRIISIE